MFEARLVITADLQLLSPLHLGTGEVETYASITYEEAGTKKRQMPTVATVMRDADGFPVIPGASVKGVLRSLVKDHSGVDELFGPPAGSSELRRGRLTAYAMRYGSAGNAEQLTRDLPFAAKPMDDSTSFGARGLYVAARTAIDPASGTADDKKLFYQEMVAPDAVFRLHLELRLDKNGTAAVSESCLMEALKALTAPDGIAFGKGQSLGQGRLCLDAETIDATRLTLDQASGKLVSTSISNSVRTAVGDATPAAAGLRHVLMLSCDGPFLIDDPSVEHLADSGLPRLNAQRHDQTPQLPGSTLSGSLRARAGWLAKLRWNDETKRRDDRGKIFAKGDMAAQQADRDRVVIDASQLSPTERLFGVTGWRGLVRVARVQCIACAGFENITSVKLDRFSMAPIDGALFTTRAAIDPVFRVVLEVEKRVVKPKDGEPRQYPNADDNVLFAALLQDLRTEGLMLGHGTSRGYGWFEVMKVGE